jgi:hypothetical protein
MNSIRKSTLCMVVLVCAAIAGTAVIPNLHPFRDFQPYTKSLRAADQIQILAT